MITHRDSIGRRNWRSDEGRGRGSSNVSSSSHHKLIEGELHETSMETLDRYTDQARGTDRVTTWNWAKIWAALGGKEGREGGWGVDVGMVVEEEEEGEEEAARVLLKAIMCLQLIHPHLSIRPNNDWNVAWTHLGISISLRVNPPSSLVSPASFRTSFDCSINWFTACKISIPKRFAKSTDLVFLEKPLLNVSLLKSRFLHFLF